MPAFPATGAAPAVRFAACFCACCAGSLSGPFAVAADRSASVTTTRGGTTVLTVTPSRPAAVEELSEDRADVEVRTTTVNLRDLDLQRNDDRMVARRRIGFAARHVCGEAVEHTVGEYQAIGACREAAAANANDALDRRVLALGPAPGPAPGTRFASADAVPGR
ncbi:MAG: UrcA family protein [Gluconacetobacter diazotrophicus]|nr:UrcA family protein [Gluconacetobacter diazotrophicus]